MVKTTFLDFVLDETSRMNINDQKRYHIIMHIEMTKTACDTSAFDLHPQPFPQNWTDERHPWGHQAVAEALRRGQSCVRPFRWTDDLRPPHQLTEHWSGQGFLPGGGGGEKKIGPWD
jgi:hypothetical protein